MKISNNALNFLLAQYRAIFKRAYIKGIASAVILTAGLAAGQAQAASVGSDGDAFYSNSGQAVTDWTEHTTPASSGLGNNVAGGYEGSNGTTSGSSDGTVDGISSGNNLSIGTGGNNDITATVSGDAFGTFVVVSGDSSIDSVSASSNNLYLNTGATVNGSAYGANIRIDNGDASADQNKGYIFTSNDGGVSVGYHTYGALVNTSNGNASATGNEVNITNSGSVAATLGVQNGDIFGARIKSESGSAFASGNKVFIDTAAITLKADVSTGNGIVGALAEGTDITTVTGNSIVIQNSAAGAKALDINTTGFMLRGGFALNQTDDVGASTLLTEGNSVELTNVNGTSASGPVVVYGGHSYNMSNSGAVAATMTSRGNTVTLDDTSIQGNTADAQFLIAGNYAQALGKSDGASFTSGQVTLAEGVAGETSVKITGGTFATTTQNEIYSSAVAGGIAENKGGDATARNHTVEISDASFDGIHLVGGMARAGLASGEANATATGNVLTITDSVLTPKVDRTSSIVGGYTNATVSGGDVTISASQNQVSINTTSDTAKTYNANVYGAYSDFLGQTDEYNNQTVKVTAANNTVTITGQSQVQGNVYGVQTDLTPANSPDIARNVALTGVYSDNKVTFGGTINGKSQGADRAIVGAGVDMSLGNSSNNVQTTFTNNVVELTADSQLTNTSLYAVQSTAYTQTADAYTITHSGNKTIVDGLYTVDDPTDPIEIIGDEIEVKDSANIYVKNGTLNIAGIKSVNESGVDGYYNGTGTVAAGATIANAGTINVYNALSVLGDSTLVATKDNARITIDAGQAKAEKNPVTEQKASLTISEAGVQNYLTSGADFDLVAGTTLSDKAGSIQVTSGGTLAFTDTDAVVLSNFDFVKGAAAAAQAGKILVDTNADNDGSIFKANELTVEHAFASNATTFQGKHEDLADIGTNGIILQANTLNLGAAGLNSSESAQIDFDHALVKENINFLAATSGKDTGINAAPDDINTGYHLTTTVIGSNFMKTNDQNSKLEYYTALDGNVNGQVKIVSGGKLDIRDGHWIANDQITVASGGSLVVGGDSKAVNKVNNSLPDATLTTSGVVLDVSAATSAGQEAKVTADGDNHGSWNGPGDDRDVILDLTSGLTMRGDTSGKTEAINGKATISAVDQGVVRLDATDVNTILGQNHRTDSSKGAFFTASGAGILQIDGEVNSTFADFDGVDTTNGFNLASDGILDGILEVTTLNVENANGEPAAGSSYQEDAAYIASSDPIEFVGTVRADDVLLNDLQLTVKSGGSTSYASQVKVGSGTLEVAKSLSSVNDTVVFGNASGAAHLVLTSDVVGDEGTVDVNTLRVDSGSITVENGVWTAQDITLSGAGTGLTVGGDTGVDQNGNDTEASLTFNHLTMGQGSEFKVEADGTATVTTADFSGLNTASAVRVAGKLTIIGANVSGDATNGVHFSNTEGALRIENNGLLRFDNLATNGAILADGDYSGTTINLQDGYTQIANNGGELYLNFDSGSSFDDEAIIAFKHELFTADSFADGMLKSGGILNIGAASFEGFNITERLEGTGLDGYTATWQQVKDFSDIYGNDVTNDVKNITNIRAIGLIDQVKGSWGSLSMDSGVATGAQVDIAGNTWLNYAAGNNGFFISNHDHSAALGAKVASQKTLTLLSGGAIGHITLENGLDDVDRNYTTLDIADGDTTIESITASNENATGTYATRVNVRSNTTVTGENGIRDVGEVNVLNGATLTTTQADIQELWVEESTANISGTLTVNGDGSVEGDGEALALGGQIKAGSIVLEDGSELNAAHGGTITTESVTVANNSTGSTIQVGFDIDTITDIISEEHENSYYTGTGYLEVSNYLDLNGARLVVDPAYDEATSVAAVMNFKNGQDKTYDTVFNDVGIVNGQVLVGKNAALGIGATLAETREAIATYQNNGALDANKYGSILYLNGQLTLDGNSEIALNSDANVKTLDGIRDSLKYTITSQVQDQEADLGLGKNTAILMTEAAFENEKGEKTGVAISFDRTNAVVNGQGGDIVLVGAFDAAQKLNFFKDNDGEGHQGAYIAGQDIKVYTQNGFLFTTLEAGTEAGYDEVLHVDTDRAYQVMSEASYPVVQTLISYHEDRLPADSNSGNDAGTDENGAQTVAWTEIKDTATKTAQAETKAGETTELTPIEPPVNNTPATKVTGSSSFLNEVVTASHGAPAEQAARLAVYGGAAQVGLAAANSNSDILESRFGIGANAQSLNVAQNGMGGTLWVAPIYKSQDSDGFDAQGLDYGVDFDLYGVALGGDYKVTNEITVGAMFNVGSGSLDGQGNAAAAGTSNDFDYFGFALYGAYQAGALTVTGDLSYTQIDNDLEGSNQVGKLTASSDTSAWSLGVTGQYQFTFASVDVTPHAGLRFTSLDLDDYSLEAAGHGTVANYDGDTMSVFSIPVGVTFAKSFEGESWTVTPALDLHVTGQFGDDEAEGSVAWTGTNLSTSVTSEVFDNFTYGATLGVEAQSNSFSFGVGLGYTGSSNVDEFGVNANARFTF